MYIETAPFHKASVSLKYSDLVNYGFRYKQIALEKIPTSQQADFVDEQQFKAMMDGTARETKGLCRKVFKKKEAVRLNPDKVLLPLNCSDRDDIATIMSGMDTVFVERASEEWLTETQFLIEQEFLRSKNQLIDQLTSHYNETAFNEFLSGLTPERSYHILLTASLASARSAKQACAHIIKTGRLLEDFNQYSFPLFHLGNSVFAFVIFDRDREFIKSFCQAITSFFRNSRQKRLHIGFSGLNAERHKAQSIWRNAQTVMDEAWTALHKASRRGPYSFCDFELFVSPGLFPIRQFDKSTRGKLSYRLKEADSFSLAVIVPDYKSRLHFDEAIKKHLGKEEFIRDDESYLVIRKSKPSSATKKWLQTLTKKLMKETDEGFSFSAGICSFPFINYQKNEIAHNCAKALYHASFYGPGSLVVFDSLSLNVSGDAYFSEGDLATAVKEYQRGMEIAQHDANLLNSLGVAYGLMNRTSDALNAFEMVLDHEPDNFMALYNKGLGELSRGNDSGALDCFSKALECADKTDPDEAAVLEDLEFQMGVCLFRQKEYSRSIKRLKTWYRSRKSDRIRERCCRYIGIGYFHLNDYKNAATWLQRALGANESDAESLSLLGEVYLVTGEGDDIAVKFCEKSIELDPGNPHFRLRYGRVLSKCGQLDNAEEVLSLCCRMRNVRSEAWLESAENYYRAGNRKNGDRFAKKIIDGKGVSTDLRDKARHLLKVNKV